MDPTITEDDLPESEELVVIETKPAPSPVDDDEDAHDVDPENPDAGENDTDREAIRERRRLEKIERKERREKAIARDKLELDFLRKRNDALERDVSEIKKRQFSADVGLVDQRLREATNEVTMAEQVIAKAVAAGNGEDVTKAMRYRDQAMARVGQLTGIKEQASAPQAAPAPDDTVVHYAKEFMREHPWYDPQGKDEDSAVVLALDQSLSRQGIDPRSPTYWENLKERIAKRLPERFTTKEEPKREARGGPAVGSGREHAPTSTRREIYISPERKQALQDAGVWDDPVLRQKYVRRYSEYDRNNRA